MTNLGAVDEDVRFDWVAADDLSAKLRSTATVLDEQGGTRTTSHDTARASWQGRYAVEFDDRVSTCKGDASRFATSMRNAADDVDELARLAREEQDRRIAAREWIASQNDDDGGLFGGVPVLGDVEDAIGDGLDAAGDFVFGEDDVPPELSPVEPPSISIGDPGPATRNSGAPAATTTYAEGGVSSAKPADLDTWVSTNRGMDETLTLRKGWLDDAHATFTAGLGWGSFDATSMLTGFGTWLTLNETDARWVADIATTFREAGAGTVSDAVIAASLNAAGLGGVGRMSVTYDDPSAWGMPPTSGYADDPVNTASGNFVEAETDLEASGLCRLLRFTRTYNSRSDRVGAFGPGWSSWASVRLRAEPDGAHWVGADGQEAVFRRSLVARSDGDGGAPGGSPLPPPFLRAPGVAGEVQPDPDGDGLVLELFGHGRLAADADGRPVWADDGPGTGVSFAFEGDRLVALAHEGGRTLTFDWDAAGERIVGVRASDGRAITFGYDDLGRLVSADGGRPGRRTYSLDELDRIVAVTDADGVDEVRNTYDDEGRVVAQLSPHGRRSRYRYAAGRVTIVDDDAAGPVNSYVHDDEGRLVVAIDGHGHELRKQYDRWGNPTVVIERDGSTTRFAWDERGRLLRREQPDGSWFTFAHDELDRVTEVVASSGAATRYAYDGDERSPSKIVDPEGGVTRLDVAGGVVRRVVDPDGVEVRYGFDGNGELTSVTDAAGNTALVERDAAGRVTATVSPSGARTEVVHDPFGRPTSRRAPDGGMTRYEWTAAGRPAAVIDPLGARREWRHGSHGDAEQAVDELGRVTTHRFDALANLVGTVLPDGAKWEFAYDRLCRLVGVSDPAGSTWLREYDAAGHLVGSVDPAGVHRTASVDAAGRVSRVDDGLHGVEFGFDDLGRPVSQRRPDGTVSTARRDRCGRIVAATAPDGGTTLYEYTAAGRLSAITSPLGHVTRYEYDRCGRRVAVVDAAGHRWSFRYDADGRVTQTIAPTGETTRLRYDAAGRVAASVSSTGGATRYEYDLCGRIVAVTDPTGGVRRFTWDAAGQLVGAVDANGGTCGYEYDEAGLLAAAVDPLGGRVEQRYDPVGRLVERTDPLGRVSRWTHDPAGRLRSVTLPTGEQTRWTYDESGRVRSLAAGSAEVRISRDVLGRPVVVDEPGMRHELGWDAAGRLVARSRNGVGLRWRYDHDGRRVAIVDPDGVETAFEHDAAGRVVGAAHPAIGEVTLTRDAVGRLTSLVAPRGAERWQYDGGLVVDHEVRSDGLHQRTRLDRDAAGRVVATTVDDAVSGYRYDATGQLVGVESPQESWTFGYDAAGRLVSETTPDRTVSYEHDLAGQLVQSRSGDETTTFTHDAAGRRTGETGPEGRTRTYEWDPFGRLAQVGDVRLRADALGDLAEVDGVALLWDPVAAVPQLRRFGDVSVVGADRPWAVVRPGGGTDWLAPDWQGTSVPPLALTGTDSSSAGDPGAVDPWGLVAGGGPAPTLAYRGELSVGGLTWLRNRAYDPTSRSFLTPDPLPGMVATPSAANPYHYAANDPVGAADPFGLRPMTEADLAAYREATAGNGLVDNLGDAWNATTDWVSDNWEYIAAGALIVGGVVIMCTGVGGPIGAAMIGGALLSGGISAGSQRALTGQVNWSQVGVDMAIGAIGGGTGAAITSTTTVSRVATTTLARGVIAGSAEGFVGGVAYQGVEYARTGQFDPTAVARDTLLGGVTGGGGAWVQERAVLGPLHRTAPDTFESSNTGLVYGPHRRDGNAVNHVLRHTIDNPTRPVAHGVFSGDRNVFEVIDDGFVRSSAPTGVAREVPYQTPQGQVQGSVIPMGDDIGYIGGQPGGAAGHPTSQHLNLVLRDGTDVVTSYPIAGIPMGR